MNTEDIKGKWENVKGNVKEAFNKNKENDTVSGLKEDVTKKDFSNLKDTAKEKYADVKPDLEKIKTKFTDGDSTTEGRA
jgi:hypothetical protein